MCIPDPRSTVRSALSSRLRSNSSIYESFRRPGKIPSLVPLNTAHCDSMRKESCCPSISIHLGSLTRLTLSCLPTRSESLQSRFSTMRLVSPTEWRALTSRWKTFSKPNSKTERPCHCSMVLRNSASAICCIRLTRSTSISLEAIGGCVLNYWTGSTFSFLNHY